MNSLRRMKWIRSLLALSIAGAALLVVMRVSQDTAAIDRGPRPLVPPRAIDPELVCEIVLERDGVRHRFVERADGWWQVEPIEFPADGWAVQQLVSRALKVESVRAEELPTESVAREAALRRAGLVPPAATLSLTECSATTSTTPTTSTTSATSATSATSSQTRVLTLVLGRRSLAGRAFAGVSPDSMTDSTAVHTGGNTAHALRDFHVVDAVLHEFALDRDVRDFRRRDLFPGVDSISGVRLTSAGGETKVVRDGNTYRIESPIRARADRARCEEFFDVVRRAKSGGFIIDRPSDASLYGLAPATATIEVTRANGDVQALRIGEAVSLGAQDRFGALGHSNAVVRLPAETLAAIVPRVDRLVDAVAAGVRARDVGAIDLVLSDTRLTLRREVAGWSASVEPILAPTDVASAGDSASRMQLGVVDANAVERLLAALCETRASAIEIAPYPSSDGVALITLRGFGREALDTVRVARRASDGRTLLENGDGVLRVHGEIDMPLDARALGFVPSAR